MKFEYDGKPDGEIVAVIWNTHLIMKMDTGAALVMPNDIAVEKLPCIRDQSWEDFLAEEYGFTKTFRKGDKVTIEF